MKFWEIENVEIDSVKTSELDISEDHFKNTHSRDDQGRYTVAMPLKEDPSCLGESKQTAIKRLNSLWKRLSRDKEYLSPKKGIGEPIKTYELTAVTYSTVSTPYLATITLKQLAMDEANNFPLAAPVVLSDCYMDDILSGSESIEEVIELQHQLIEMFKAAGMHLHNCCAILVGFDIVISWIHRESRELKTFVANRVSKIHQLSSCDQWHHIASEQNPADVLSRRLLPEELRDDSLWWHGPELLQSTYSTTVIAEPTQRDDFDCELRVSERTLETSLLNSKNFDFFNHLMDLSNNYFKIIHIISYIYRFIESCRSKVKKRGPLTTSEDDKGVLRVGGRLEKASIPYSQKHPAILAKNSKLSKIYFITLHKKLFHVGPQGLLNAVRLRLWALGCRNLARKTVHTCVVCFKCKPIPSSQIMGNFPYERVNMAPPFSITGLDLGGPYFVTYKHQRKGVLNKIYVCVCICFVTRAIHLEILSDLTSDAIIATLKRFMSRRGKCSKIFTDNATNFVGANSQLKVFYKTLNFPDQNLAAYFTEEGIEWNFIPLRAPHMGGLWEVGIKSVKYHLKRALGRSRLTYEEFETVIIQMEGILHSRPLTPISNDFDNFESKPLAENNKGNSGSLEKMEYRLSEYSPTERKVDDREGQCNVWYNGNCKGGFATGF
ncbi:integrase catalytic domain-containing protein [Trichonephila clavipes]|nr:integrase catalytic domain-containing protein [Trichonephila clavipes]